MTIIIQDKNNFVLRFDQGEDILELLAKFMGEKGINACIFNGVGACSFVELWYYNLKSRDYGKRQINEEMEIASLSGNGGMKDGKPAIHAHGVFGTSDFTAIAGHVHKIIISATCEIFLTKLEGEMRRKPNEDLHLNLLA